MDYARRIIMLSVCYTLVQCVYAQSWNYPPTRTEPFDTVIFNTRLQDDYAWLSRSSNGEEMLTWARKQGDFTNHILDSVTGTPILNALLDKFFAPDPNSIIVKGTQGEHCYYYATTSDGSRWMMKRSYKTGMDEKIIPLPWTVNGRRYTAKKLAFAHQKNIVAIMMVESGELNPHIRFFDLNKKTFLNDSIAPVMFNDASGVSMAWLPDDSGLIYSQAPATNKEDETYYRGKLKLHLIGTKPENDEAIFGFGVSNRLDIKEYETPYVYSSPGSPYVLARVRAGKGDNYAFAVHYTKLNGATTKWVRLQDYRCNHGTFALHKDFIYAIDDGAPNMQVIKVDMKTGAKPTVFLKESEKILATSTGDPSIIAAKDALYIKYSEPGKDGLLKMLYSGKSPIDVPLPFDGSIGEFAILDDNNLLFVITNWIYDYRYFVIKHPENVIEAFGKRSDDTIGVADYKTEIIYVPSRDGAKIPVSLVYHKNTRFREKPCALLIETYGCFGASMNPLYNPEAFLWLELGGVYAVAHVRGGGDLGPGWAAAGSFPTKMNSINDVVDVGEYMVKQGFSTGDMQALTGTSCGTLNVGLASLQRPDLFSAGVYIVGIPDLVTPKDASFGRGQNEFGPLDTREGFESRLSISAHHQIVPDEHAPAMLAIISFGCIIMEDMLPNFRISNAANDQYYLWWIGRMATQAQDQTKMT